MKIFLTVFDSFEQISQYPDVISVDFYVLVILYIEEDTLKTLVLGSSIYILYIPTITL